jgi:hypothetical protein
MRCWKLIALVIACIGFAFAGQVPQHDEYTNALVMIASGNTEAGMAAMRALAEQGDTRADPPCGRSAPGTARA